MIQLSQNKTGNSHVPQSHGELLRTKAEDRSLSHSCACDRSITVIGHPAASRIALFTGGGDKPYALGLAAALTSTAISVDFIGSDELNVPEVIENPRVHFLNLRGDQRPEAGRASKLLRVSRYYIRLIRYAASARPPIFHILWNNKIEVFDRTLLMLYYKLLGKRLVFTAHNVNARKRDGNDSWLNRLTLRAQYKLLDHIFVHTEAMKTELSSEFCVPESKVSVIPFGINNTVPNTTLSRDQAKRYFGLNSSDKTLLFFGNIAPYKGLEYLTAAFAEVSKNLPNYRLIIGGRPKGCESYWRRIEQGNFVQRCERPHHTKDRIRAR